MEENEFNEEMFAEVGKNEKNASRPKKKSKSGGFQTFGLSESVFRAIMKRGYKVPTAIQRKAIPLILKNKDVVAMARTGSGKSAAFIVPMLEKLGGHEASSGPRALILSPTRELALQTLKFTRQLGNLTDLVATAVLGGEKLEEQFSNLHARPDIIIATPGRFVHLCVEMDLKLNDVKYVVFDEADRLFEMGFQEQINDIIRRLPTQRQTVLFSATLPKMLVDFAKVGLFEPELIRLDVEMKLNENLKLIFFHLRHDDKTALFLHLVRNIIPENEQIVVFVSTRHHCEFLCQLLDEQQQKNIFSATTIYSSLDHTTRKINLSKYLSKKCRILIVTDIAARGLDIPSLDNVVNFHFPSTPKIFLHRVGRVARAGREGTAFSFISTDELSFLFDVEEFIGKTIRFVDEKDENEDFHLLFGKVPQTIIDEESETIKKITETNVDLQNLFQVQQNAYQHYLRSRPPSSFASVKQLKKMNTKILNMKNHPIFKRFYTEQELTPNLLAEQLKNFQPRNTIFEVNPSANNDACQMMKRKRKHDQKSILTHKRKDQQNLDEIQPDENKKTLQLDDLTITVQDENFQNDGNESKSKRKKINRREIDKEFFIPYRPSDFQREKGLEVNSFERQTNESMMDLTNDDGSKIRAPAIQKTKWDRKKKKFVTVGQPDGKTKKIKTESGQWITASYKTNAYKKWLNKSGVTDKTTFDHREKQSHNAEQISSAQEKPGKFKEKVQQLMNRQKNELKSKGQRGAVRSELKKPEEILKKRTEKRQRNALQRSRQMRKSGRTNYKNKRRSGQKRFSQNATSKSSSSSKGKRK